MAPDGDKMSVTKIGLAEANTNHSNNTVSYDRDEWLQNQWKQGATVWTLPFSGGGGRT